jgi:hypothetical protein
MNRYSRVNVFITFCALLLAPDAFATQGLCVNSPENPTVVLGLLGAAAAGYPMVRERARGLFKRIRGAGRQDGQP